MSRSGTPRAAGLRAPTRFSTRAVRTTGRGCTFIARDTTARSTRGSFQKIPMDSGLGARTFTIMHSTVPQISPIQVAGKQERRFGRGPTLALQRAGAPGGQVLAGLFAWGRKGGGGRSR